MSHFRRNKILILENDQKIRLLLQEFLEVAGCRLIKAENIREVVRLALEEIPDLIITDLNLPEEDAIKAIRNIRRKKSLAEIPILASSNDGKLGIELFLNIEHLGNGPIEYITRPFSLGTFAEQIEILLTRRKKAA